MKRHAKQLHDVLMGEYQGYRPFAHLIGLEPTFLTVSLLEDVRERVEVKIGLLRQRWVSI
jgi:hypothetical protein